MNIFNSYHLHNKQHNSLLLRSRFKMLVALVKMNNLVKNSQRIANKKTRIIKKIQMIKVNNNKFNNNKLNSNNNSKFNNNNNNHSNS